MPVQQGLGLTKMKASHVVNPCCLFSGTVFFFFTFFCMFCYCFISFSFAPSFRPYTCTIHWILMGHEIPFIRSFILSFSSIRCCLFYQIVLVYFFALSSSSNVSQFGCIKEMEISESNTCNILVFSHSGLFLQ